MSTYMDFSFQDFNSPPMMMMMNFYDFMMTLLFMILLMIFYMMMCLKTNSFINLNILHNQMVEMIWTVIPVVLLFFMAVPSLKLLYYVEEIFSPYMSLKILGHQWYWSYEYSDFLNINFDSFMSSSNLSDFRLLDVDNRLILPFMFKIRSLVASMDVIHSWAMPSMGVKIDATPGRINQFILIMSRPGLFFGQCSEICGVNHSFMPIVIESIDLMSFFKWIKSF
nr:cytochrome c oxidase subunit 2 [Meteorus sp. 1 XHS-2023a]